MNIASVDKPNIRLQPFDASGWNARFNFDGFMTYTKREDSPTGGSYVQLFRNGAIEAISARMLMPWEGKKLIASVAFEQELFVALQRYLDALHALEFDPPVFVMLSLLGVKGYTMSVGMNYWQGHGAPIDRDALLVPEIIVESYETDATKLLRPAFDAVWQACGWERSPNYDRDGNWKAHA